MANEITVEVRLSVTKDSTREALNNRYFSTMVGKRIFHNKASIGIVEEQLDFGEIVTGGMFHCINRDPTNAVILRPSSGVFAHRLNPGESCLIRTNPAGAIPYAQALVAPVEIEYLVFEA